MAIDEEVPIRGVFVLANARLDNRRLCEGREAACDKTPRPLHPFWRGQAGLCVGVHALAMCVAGKFQAACLDVRHAVGLFLLEQPCWQRGSRKTRIAGGCAEEEYFLPSGEDSLAKHSRNPLAEPRTTRKHELASGDSRTG